MQFDLNLKQYSPHSQESKFDILEKETLDTKHLLKQSNSGEVKSSVTTSFLNIINTTIGAAILALPFFIKQYGLIIGSSVICTSCGLSIIAAHLYIKASNETRLNDLAEIAGYYFNKKGNYFVKFLILVSSFITCQLFTIIIGDICEKIFHFENYSNFFFNREMVSIYFLTLMIPFLIQKNLEKLKIVSYVTFSAVCLFVGFTIFNFAKKAVNNQLSSKISLSYPEKSDIVTFFKGVPTIFFGFGYQMNYYPIKKNLHHYTDGRMMKTVGLASFFIVVTYLMVGVFGYLSYGDYITQDFLRSFQESEIGVGCYYMLQIAYGMLMLAHYPMIFFQGRNYLVDVCQSAYNFFKRERNAEIMSIPNYEQPQNKKFQNMIFIAFTVGYLSIITFAGLVFTNVIFMTDLIGAVVSVCLVVMFPNCFIIQSYFISKKRKDSLFYLCCILSTIGISIIILALSFLIFC